uniref:zinc finger protein CONSTANS-LIKE 16-like isoform X2 n=1 Tax=Erigeron canadensis TaxID=72917 RepID=UPI001CB8A5B7|nr:zinc finger protein CONSTANS-LIKE 16-like isoform X2 [Erigeron canadensis]
MISGKKTANAVGGKNTTRACDSCVRKRARWYCAADDAFLCQSCDGSVHSANQLAGRHERVLLDTSFYKVFGSSDNTGSVEPSWHQGFTRRARTTRTRSKYSLKLQGTKNNNANSFVPLVPDLGALEASLLDDNDDEEVEEQLLYRVPVFDPFETELCNASSFEAGKTSLDFVVESSKQEEETCNLDDLQGFDLPTEDLELLEFATDVENLLGICFDENRVKVEDKEIEAILGFDLEANNTKETMLDWDFGYESIIKDEEKKASSSVEMNEHMMIVSSSDRYEVQKPSIILRLDYEDVINTWADQGSPWTNGTRPELNSDGCWPDFMGDDFSAYGGGVIRGGGSSSSDGAREARVLRYREKRRTRLFSKKIRYEVRKLNAEKRPRMKGRFVKRENFPPHHHPPTSTFSTTHYLINN